MFLLIAIPMAVGAEGLGESRPLFMSDETLIARVEGPLTTIMRDRSETEYQDARFTYIDAAGAEQELKVKLRTRGVYRRRKEICSFAPLRLNFPRKKLADTEFAGQDKLKLVTHCVSGRGNYQQYVLKEYLAYRILQAFTEQSFRTRLIRMTYVDTDRKNRETTKYAFVIEEKEHVGERLGIELVKVPSIELDKLVQPQTNLVVVFQYFIGNTDYSAVLGATDDYCCHNIVLYSATPGTYIPIPYDFDLAGIVNTPYATSNPKYKLSAVTERLYRGLCRNSELLKTTLARFAEKEQELRALLDGLEGLSKRDRRLVRRYIDEFYEDFESQKALDKNFLKECSYD
jgi:hypothetical protein